MLRPPSRVFYGWWVVAAGFLIATLGGGIYFYGFTVLFLPLAQDMKLSRAATSLIFSLSRAEGAIGGPPAGFLIDRLGARKMLVLGSLLIGVGYLVLSQVHSYWLFLLVYLGLISLGFNIGFFSALLAAVNQWFVRRRALAMSITMSALGAGGAFIVPLLSTVVLGWGWRTAAFFSGLAFLFLGIPLSLLVRPSPESAGLLPDGDPPASSSSLSSPAERDVPVKEALRTRAYWLLTAAVMVRLGAFSALFVHLVPILVWRGLDQQAAANLVGFMALLTIPARIFSGWVGDRLSKQWVTAIGTVLGTLAIPLLILGKGMTPLYLFAILFAVADGVGPLSWALVGDFFGRRHFATLRGFMSLFHTWGMMVLPVWAGRYYDTTGSYGLVLWTLAAIFVFSAFLFTLVRRPPQGVPA